MKLGERLSAGSLRAGQRVEHKVRVGFKKRHRKKVESPEACQPRLVCARHGHSPNGVQVPCMKTRTHESEEQNTSRSQRVAGDRRSERRLCKTRVPMNKNLIEGRRDGASWHNTAKPTGEVVEVNQAAVRGRTVSLPGEVWDVRAFQNRAERDRQPNRCPRSG